MKRASTRPRMRGNLRTVQMKPLVKFFSLTFAITWICFITTGMLPPGSALRWPLLILGAFAPSTVAVYLTSRADGKAGARALLARLGDWRHGIQWYVFALCFMAAIKFSVALIYRVSTGGWPAFGPGYEISIVLTAIVAAIFGGPLGEEIGWRGYALPRLASQFGRARSSVILGVIWALWHLPVFFIAGMDQSGQALPVYILQVIALSVAMAWLYWHTNGSLLLAVLMHTAINQTKDLVPSTIAGASNPLRFNATPVAWLTVVLLWIVASFFLLRSRDAKR